MSQEASSSSAADIKALLRTPFDPSAWQAASSPQLHLRIANNPVCVGREAAFSAICAFLSRIEQVGCRYFESWERAGALFAETDVCFRDGSGRRVELPCALVARSHRRILVDLRLYLDPSAVP